MYNKLLVTLDGSPLAESALHYAAELANTAGAEEVMLLRFVEAWGAPGIQEADRYLGRSAKQLVESQTGGKQLHSSLFPSHARDPHGVQWISSPITQGGIAESILEFSDKHSVDMLMMSALGASGMVRWPIGPVAEKVLWSAKVPVLLVRPEGGVSQMPYRVRRFLVPLDGSEPAEQALPQVEHFARAGQSEVSLLFVQPIAEGARGLRESTNLGLGLRCVDDISANLNSLASQLTNKGVKGLTKIRAGHPAQQIIEEARAGHADVIVMSSYKPTGLPRWALGSVADQVVRGAPIPVLLVPAVVENPVPMHRLQSY